MRTMTVLALAAGLLSAGAAWGEPCLSNAAYFAEVRERVLSPPPGHVVVAAHRACFSAAPENSPEAIDACWRLGVEVVENDVRSTRDGELVVMHDDTVDRMTDGWGYLDDLTLSDLERFRLRDGDGGPGAYVTPAPVTTLRAYFRAARGKVMINLEMKPSASADFETLVRRSLDIAREEGVIDQVVLKIPDVRSHGRVSRTHVLTTLDLPPDVAIWPIIWESQGADPAARVAQLEPYGPTGYEVPFTDPAFFSAVARDARLRGRPIMAVAVRPYWSGGLSDAVSLPNPEAGWGRLIALGANVLMTDHPEYLLRYLDRSDRRLAIPTARCAVEGPAPAPRD